MKSYLIVFFVLLSFVGFGQEEEVSPEDMFEFCFFYKIPIPDESLLHNTFYNHFEDIFPAKQMKSNNIKTFYISEFEEDDGMPSIKVRSQKQVIAYRLNKSGYVISYQDNFYNYIFYDRDENNRIVSKYDSTCWRELFDFDIINSWNIEYSEFQYFTDSISIKRTSRDSSQYSIIYNDNQPEIHRRTILSDSKNRMLSAKIFHWLGNTGSPEYLRTNHQYDEDNYIRTSVGSTFQIDTTFFDKQWRPISEKYYNDFNQLENQYDVIYENDRIVQYKATEIVNLEPIDEETPIDEDNIILEPYIDFRYKTLIMLFHYNTNGLLEKIIQTTNDGTCEYRVYYYTE